MPECVGLILIPLACILPLRHFLDQVRGVRVFGNVVPRPAFFGYNGADIGSAVLAVGVGEFHDSKRFTQGADRNLKRDDSSGFLHVQFLQFALIFSQTSLTEVFSSDCSVV